MENRMGNNHEWDGVDRRNPTGWDRYEMKVLSDISEVKGEIKDIKTTISQMQIGFTEMKTELKQVVSASATKTSSVVSTIVSTIGGIIVYVLTGLKG